VTINIISIEVNILSWDTLIVRSFERFELLGVSCSRVVLTELPFQGMNTKVQFYSVMNYDEEIK
jgi:hypothetical protein